MFPSPASHHPRTLLGKRAPNTRGGNLARVLFTHAGLSLFRQLPQQFEADNPNRGEAAPISSWRLAPAGAAINRRPSHAESRPFVSVRPQINHFRHPVFLSGPKATESGFAPLQKGFAP